jgi:hypothetical protein
MGGLRRYRRPAAQWENKSIAFGSTIRVNNPTLKNLQEFRYAQLKKAYNLDHIQPGGAIQKYGHCAET